MSVQTDSRRDVCASGGVTPKGVLSMPAQFTPPRRIRKGGRFAASPIAERFWLRVNFAGATPDRRPDLGPCWLWMGSRSKEGYGTFRLGPTHVKSHRWAYEFCIGVIPARLTLDHLCFTPPCVNPGHAEPVSLTVNVLRGGNSIKTHCPQGHPYDEANTYTMGSWRYCRACHYAHSKAYRQRAVPW